MVLLAGLWPGSLAALVLGLAVGWIAGPPSGRAIPVAFGAATVALAALCVSGLVPGVAGYWLESATAMLVPYFAGCALGTLLRKLPGVRPNDPPTT